MAQQRDTDTVGRWLGLLSFLLGIGLMLMVFVWAARLFDQVGVGKDLLMQSNPDARTMLGEWAIHWLVKVALVFALGYVASLIAARGISLYLATRSLPKE